MCCGECALCVLFAACCAQRVYGLRGVYKVCLGVYGAACCLRRGVPQCRHIQTRAEGALANVKRMS